MKKYICSDENAPAGGVGGAGSGRHLPSREDRKENELAAGPWTKAKVVKKSQNVPLDSIAQYSKPAFQVYEEPSSSSTQSSGLSTGTGDFLYVLPPSPVNLVLVVGDWPGL